ncbi:MAG: DUF1501 domain-containing protein [Gemmataceae bacterium]
MPDFAAQTRRQFLRSSGLGLGSLALAGLAGRTAEPHFPAKAKNVIVLHMSGAPPHLDMFDYKPELVKHNGEPCPDSLIKGKTFAFTSGVPKLLGTPQKFKQHGKGGAWVSEVLPGIASIADDLTFIKSMYTEQFNHAPAELLLYTGSPRQGRPSMGSWVTYGLGSESQDLPGFIVLVSGGTLPSAGKSAWGSGFLPSVFQGVQCRTGGDPVLYVTDPEGMDRHMRRMSLDAIKDLNEMQAKELRHPETQTRIAQYEMAFRMQIAVPEVMDITREPKQVIDNYGAQPGAASFANNCLLARRLVEKGVRFVQLFDWGWDFHGTGPGEDIKTGLPKRCQTMDRPVTALIKDLKARGMLDSTLVIWTGEFGRTPFREGRTAASANLGRDHHPNSYSMFLAGAGLKPGVSYGASDDLGFYATENPVHVHDLQATVLQLLGFDHTRLTYRFQGRDFRLTDVHGKVVKEILA